MVLLFAYIITSNPTPTPTPSSSETQFLMKRGVCLHPQNSFEEMSKERTWHEANRQSQHLADNELVERSSEELTGKSFRHFTSCSLVKCSNLDCFKNLIHLHPNSLGCCLMPNGEAVVCNIGDYSVTVVDTNMNMKLQLPRKMSSGGPVHPSNDVARLDDRRVVVSIPTAKILQILSVIPALELGREIVLKYACYGLACYNNNIYVSTDDLNRWSCFVCAGIEVLSENGDVIKTIQLFERPDRIFPLNDGNIMYTVHGKKQVKCVGRDSSKIPEFLGDRNCIMDEEGNQLCCYRNSVLIRQSDGKDKILLQKQEGFPVSEPSAVCYNKSNHFLLYFYVSRFQGNYSMMLEKYKLEY